MKKQPRVVLFVGAGASRACGYPLTGDILPEILRRLKTGTFNDVHIQNHAPALRRMLSHLIPTRGHGGVPQITELLSVIDHCLESGEELFPASPKSLKLTDARWLLERAMSRVIKKIHVRETVPREIADWAQALRRDGKHLTIISTNYDFSLDRVLFEQLGDWNVNYLKTDFGFTWRDPDNGDLVHPSADAKLRLYKLHGSLNWLACHRCGNIYVNFARTVVDLADGSDDWSTCHCAFKPLRAVLVAPSFVRRYRDRNLLSVWRSAWEMLRLADDMVFIGYSLPPEDVGIRSLLMRAMFARTKRPHVRVVSADDDALPRYRQIFPDCDYTGDGLRRFLDDTCSWQRAPTRVRRRAPGRTSKKKTAARR
jgi:NAD-dependent SIR2 family protein deacetylase